MCPISLHSGTETPSSDRYPLAREQAPSGVYKGVFRVTEDGYIWTNVFDYAYLFRIGREAAERIFSYAAENGIEAEPERHPLA